MNTISSYPHIYRKQLSRIHFCYVSIPRNVTSSTKKKIEECHQLLNIPLNSKQDVVRKAFLELAKKYHPDSGSPEANVDKFVDIENAFRTLTKHNTGNFEEAETIVYDIRHTAPQHRQYLSFEGVGFGTPYQRQKQWTQVKAQRAANNIMEHRVAKAVASENALMKKGQHGKKHDIKTKYGFDRIVEDLIQESISKGEFDNLSGKGKPLKNQNRNPYVDFTTHKLNEVLINNGFTPEWISMAKEIDMDIDSLKKKIQKDRMGLGPYPLSLDDTEKWACICNLNRELAQAINTKINTYNLIVPLMNKQKFYVRIEAIFDEVLKNGEHSLNKVNVDKISHEIENARGTQTGSSGEDLFSIFFKALGELFSFKKEIK